MYDSIGGESMKSIRRNVFGVIIYHLGLIEYASNFLENRIKIQSNNSDPILSNLHKSLEPLLDHILNKHRNNNVDYTTFQKDIFDKCNFLMKIEPAIKVNNEVLINNQSDSIIPPSLNPNGLSATVLHVFIYICYYDFSHLFITLSYLFIVMFFLLIYYLSRILLIS